LKCQGELIKAHSLILRMRSEYFNTALDTDVGAKENSIDVKGCLPHVLAAVVDFMYGIEIDPGALILSHEDLESLLNMANLYLLDDLKDLVGAFISKELVQKPPGTRILAFSQLAEKYSAQKMQEACCDHLLDNFSQFDKEVLDELFLALPMLGKKAWEKLTTARPQDRGDIACKVLGINSLTNHFKTRVDFPSYQDYKGYIMAHLQANMLVLLNQCSVWKAQAPINVAKGTIGRVISWDINEVVVKWSTGRTLRGPFIYLELLTTAINTNLFT